MTFLRNVLKCSLLHNYNANFRTLIINSRMNMSQLALKPISSTQPASTPCIPANPLDITFENTKTAFKSKTTWEVCRAYIVYSLCSFEYIVENNMKIMKILRNILGDKVFTLLMKTTFYGHFVAGEDEKKIMPYLERLRSFGIKPILDYSVEEDLTQEEAEKREVESSVPEAGDEQVQGAMKQYHVNKAFADRRYKVYSARTYFYLNEAQCERNMEIFIKSLEAIAHYDTKSEQQIQNYNCNAVFESGIIAIKLTALGRPQLLLQLSEVIARTRQYVSEIDGRSGNVLGHHIKTEYLEKKLKESHIDQACAKQFLQKITTDKEGILHLFPWSGILDENYQLNETFKVPDLKTGKMVRLMTQLTAKEEEMFKNMIRRLNTICKLAKELNVSIMIDAEQTYFQPAISRITLEMMRKYNKDKVIVFNTYQNYLKTTFNEVQTDLEQAKRQDFHFGAKLVRGAYLDQERARATVTGYPDLTNPDFDATTAMYFKTLSECLRRIKEQKDKGQSPKIGILVASHNEATVRFAVAKMEETGISPDDKVISFGQLLGMCDYITYSLGQAGYSVYKYIPYGPVNEVLPYLSRRAQENKGMLKKIKKEKQMLLSEILRRTATLQFFYKQNDISTSV